MKRFEFIIEIIVNLFALAVGVLVVTTASVFVYSMFMAFLEMFK